MATIWNLPCGRRGNETRASAGEVRGEAIAFRQQPGDNAIKSILRMDGASAPTRLFSHSAIFLRRIPSPLPAYIKQASISAIRGIPPRWSALWRGPVAILGMGLTALDVLFRLTSSSDTRKIYLVSRHGLFPQPHRFNPKPPAAAGFPPFLEICLTVRAYSHAVRSEIRKNADRAATGATLSTFSAPIRRKYGNVPAGRAEEDFFLALSLTGIFIVIGSRHPLICA